MMEYRRYHVQRSHVQKAIKSALLNTARALICSVIGSRSPTFCANQELPSITMPASVPSKRRSSIGRTPCSTKPESVQGLAPIFYTCQLNKINPLHYMNTVCEHHAEVVDNPEPGTTSRLYRRSPESGPPPGYLVPRAVPQWRRALR